MIGPGFEELEFFVPVMRLQEDFAEVVVAGEQAGKSCFEKHGNCMGGKAEIGFDQVEPGDFDAVMVPGGWAPDKMRREPFVKKS